MTGQARVKIFSPIWREKLYFPSYKENKPRHRRAFEEGILQKLQGRYIVSELHTPDKRRKFKCNLVGLCRFYIAEKLTGIFTILILAIFHWYAGEYIYKRFCIEDK